MVPRVPRGRPTFVRGLPTLSGDVRPLPEDARPLVGDARPLFGDARLYFEYAGDEFGRPGDRSPCAGGFPDDAREEPRLRHPNVKWTDFTTDPASAPTYSMLGCDPIALPGRA